MAAAACRLGATTPRSGIHRIRPRRDAATDTEGPPSGTRLTDSGHAAPDGESTPTVDGGAPGAAPVPATVRADVRRTALVLGVLFGLTATGSSAAAVVLPELRSGLRLDAASTAWVLSIYALALAVTTAVYGRVADVAGIRRPMVVGVFLMAAGALLSALAPSLPVLLLGRVLQGAGAGSVPVLATALISARYSGAARTSALGQVAGASAAVSALGPLLGGAVEAAGGWRAAIALPAAGLLLLPFAARAAPTGGTGGHVDVPGAALVAGAASGLVLLLQSVAAGPVVAGAGAALLLACTPLTVRHVRRRPEGFLPLAVITRGPMVRAVLAGASIPAAWFALLLSVPATLHDRGWTTLEVGAALVPSAVIGLLAAQVAGRVMQRLGAPLTLAGSALLAAATLLTTALAVRSGWAFVLAAAVVAVTVSFSIGQPAMVWSVGNAVPSAVRGIALGVATLMFLVGGSLGAAAVGGLADTLGVPGALASVAVLPAVGALVVLVGDRRRAARTAV